jgi:hypothetical protein
MQNIQLSFTPEEAEILAFRAQPLGYTVTKYIKLLVNREILAHLDDRSYALGTRAIGRVERAQEEYEKGKAKKLTDVLDNLGKS